MTPRQKETLFISIGVLILVALGMLVVWFFTLGTIKIVTDSPSNTITLRKSSINIGELTDTEKRSISTAVKAEQKDNILEAKVSPGTYIATVTGSNKTKSQLIEVTAGKTIEVRLTIGTVLSMAEPEPVTSLGALSIASDSNKMRILDGNDIDGVIYSIDSNGNVLNMDNSVFYKKISWSKSPNFGVGTGINKKDKRYVVRKITDNNIETVITPFKPSEKTTVGVSPNKNWYVSDGHSVYQGFSDGSFKKLMATTDNIVILSASDSAVLLQTTKPNSMREGNLVSLHSDKTKYQIRGSVYEAKWSPDGSKLFTTGDGAGVFDDKLNKLSIAIDSNVAGISWLDNNTLIYGIQNQLIKYSLNDNSTNTGAVFSDPANPYIALTSPSESGDYIYTTIQTGGLRQGLNYKTYRVPMKNQARSEIPVDGLGIIIPNTTYGCRLDFVNFINFSLITRQIDKSSNCQEVANAYLSSYNISISNLKIQQL